MDVTVPWFATRSLLSEGSRPTYTVARERVSLVMRQMRAPRTASRKVMHEGSRRRRWADSQSCSESPFPSQADPRAAPVLLDLVVDAKCSSDLSPGAAFGVCEGGAWAGGCAGASEVYAP